MVAGEGGLHGVKAVLLIAQTLDRSDDPAVALQTRGDALEDTLRIKH